MKLDKGLYERISNLTGTEYEVIYTKDADDDFVWVFNDDVIESMMEDLLVEIGRLEEQLEDIKKDREDNYRRISVEEQIGD